MFRNLRTFSFFSRSVYRPRSALSQYHGTVAVRRVRFVRPKFTFKRMQIWALYAACIGAPWYLHEFYDDGEEGLEDQQALRAGSNKVVPEDAPKKVQNPDSGKASEADTEDDVHVPDEAPEDSWFIPLGLIYQRHPTFYKGNDPEWQSFIAFSKDMKRNSAVRNELAGLVGNAFAATPALEPLLGSPIRIGKYWLDVDYPGGPPPEYERAGLEITNEYIAWTVRPVSSINISRLERTLWNWPKATLLSLWASSRVLWEHKFAKVRDFWDYRIGPEPTMPRFPPAFRSLPGLRKPEDQAGGTSTPVSSTMKAPSDEPLPASREVPGNSERRVVWPISSEEMEDAFAVFKNNLAQQWQPPTVPLLRGSVLVSGLVQVLGSKGSCVVDVAASYDPQESRFVAISMTVRRAQPKSIPPPGGL